MNSAESDVAVSVKIPVLTYGFFRAAPYLTFVKNGCPR